MNYEGDIVFEDDDDSWSALTEDVSQPTHDVGEPTLTHGTPFSPVVFQPRVRNVVPKVVSSAPPYESDAQRAMLAAIQTPPKSRVARGDFRNRRNNNNDDDDAMILAESRQSHNRRSMGAGNPRGPALAIKSPTPYEKNRKPQYTAIGFSVDNRARNPIETLNAIRSSANNRRRNDENFPDDDDDNRNSNGMGYLPSRHFQQFAVDTKAAHVGRPMGIGRMSHQREPERQHSSLSNWSELRSPSNESQNTLSTIRSNHSIQSARSRRSAVSYHSSTGASMLHGEVINLEGNAAYAKHNENRMSKHSNHGAQWDNRFVIGDDDDDSQIGLNISGMEIGGSSALDSEGRRSGGRSFLSSHGFSSTHQEKYQSDGREPVFTFGIASEHIMNAQKHASKLGKDAKMGVVKIHGRAASVARQIMSKYYRPPLSPRSRELKDLEFLKQSHKEKFNHLKLPNGNDESFLSNGDEDDDDNFFDFVIVLTPQESYEYWANLLDFREEYLGLDSSDVWGRELESSPGFASTNTTDSRGSGDAILPIMKNEGAYNQSPESADSDEHGGNLSTPQTGLLRRKSIRTPPPSNKTPNRRASLQAQRYFDSHQKSRFSQFSQRNLRSPFEGTPLRKGLSRLSMFERAIQSPTLTNSRRGTISQHSYYSHSTHTVLSEARNQSGIISETPATTMSRIQPASTIRRRWGNPGLPPTTQSNNSLGTRFSSPIRSLKRKDSEGTNIPIPDSEKENGPVNQQKTLNGKKPLKVEVNKGKEVDEENKNPNIIDDIEEMTNPVIPRGFAVRRNGMMRFLSALQGGIVLRRHCPNKEAAFCKLSSDNGGETIKVTMVDSAEAMAAFKSQRIRYNRNFNEATSPTSLQEACAAWSCLEVPSPSNSANKFIPDHVASQKYREKFNREHGVFKRMFDVAMNEANAANFDAKDIVALHPATKVDRRSPGMEKDELGTASFRRSLSPFDNQFSFSLITASSQPFIKVNSENLTDTWQQGEGSEHLFKTLDFEAATEGEYWLVLRGLLLVYRDAMNKKLNVNGKTGFGGGEPNGIGGGAPTREIRLQRDMYVEPSTVGRLEKLVVKMRKLNDDYIRGAVMPGAVPPPSDYFLGFKSTGTQIWSRLRWAGFETQRVFSADPRKVMIKIRCPEDRLTDVAEVLRLKMKTKDGTYAPFQEDAAHIFKTREDLLDIPNIYRGGMASLLRSRDRQNIIDFIIGSRIRDSGAELTQNTPVGKMIEAKVPLHMPNKLDSLYNAWVCYWKREHWTGIETSESSTEGSENEEGDLPRKGQDDDEKQKDHRPIPNFLTRFFVEAFNQPLDAIEDYFGEKVTFYFAWMQHSSIHLLFLAFFGMIVFFCQVSIDYNHWLRPWFSLAVMIWTFIVLLNWRKRSNYLAYRWGSMDYKEAETVRPEFYGNYIRDPITDEWVIKYPSWKRWCKRMVSLPVTIFFTGFSLFLILLAHANRDMQMAKYVEGEVEFTFSLANIGQMDIVEKVANIEVSKEYLMDFQYWIIMLTWPSILGLCIPILNIILMNLARSLNDFENYRTENEYRTHLIVKVFSFRFVSQFGTVYYYAIVSAMIGTEKAFENGMIRMSTSLIIYTTVAHWWNIILQVYVFMGIRNLRHHFYAKRLRRELKKIELLEEEYNTNERCDAEVREISLINKRILLDQAQDDLWMEVMCPPHDSFPEYITAVVQFSFVACFSVILPCIPFIVLINHLLSMRFDAFKLCKVRRRPLAQRTGGIGVWQQLLHIVAVIAVLTNVWLVAYFHPASREFLAKLGPEATVVFLVLGEHFMLLVKYLMGHTISTLPKELRDEIKEKQHEGEKKRREDMRVKTDQTRRLKREKSMSMSSSYNRLLSVTPDSTLRAESVHTQNLSKGVGGDVSRDLSMTTPEIGGPLQTIESFEESTGDPSISENTPGQPRESTSSSLSSNIYHQDRSVRDSFSARRTKTPEANRRLQTIESFEESVDDQSITNDKPGGIYNSMPRARKAPIHSESKNARVSPTLEESIDENEVSFLDSKPGELFEC